MRPVIRNIFVSTLQILLRRTANVYSFIEITLIQSIRADIPVSYISPGCTYEYIFCLLRKKYSQL